MTGIDASMFELFREEVKAHADTLAAGLIAAEANVSDPTLLESLMRSAHSIKGAARIINIDTAVRLAHVMEDALVAAQDGKIRLKSSDIDTLLTGADVLAGLAALTQDTVSAWETTNAAAVTALEPQFVAMAEGKSAPPPPVPSKKEEESKDPSPNPSPKGRGASDSRCSGSPFLPREGGRGGRSSARIRAAEHPDRAIPARPRPLDARPVPRRAPRPPPRHREGATGAADRSDRGRTGVGRVEANSRRRPTGEVRTRGRARRRAE